jgi:hypothetical protein
LRRSLLAAWFALLLASLCICQAQASQANTSQSQTSQPQTSQAQASPSQTSQSQSTQSQPAQAQSADKDNSGNSSSGNQGQFSSSKDTQEPAETQPGQKPPAQGQSGQPSGEPPFNPNSPNQPSSSKPPQLPAEKNPTPQYQQESTRIPITLDSSETIFSVLTALNACGYDQDLGTSDPTRSKIRAEVQRNLQSSTEAEAARDDVCDFYQSHAGDANANRDLAPYISLALYMDGPPHFVPRVKEDELPPDAVLISAFGTRLERFYEKAGLHAIWEHHRKDYAAAMVRYHEPLAKMVLDTEVYLKQPSAQYLGRNFTIYLDFMGSPNETDARNYGTDYDVIVFPALSAGSSPGPDSALKMDQIRHTFLHYEMDPLADKHYSAIKRLEPLLLSVQRAPLEISFKTDISLLVTECMVRAIEIRTSGNKQTPEAMRAQAVDDAVKAGYILTRTFYEDIVGFEKDPEGMRSVYSTFLDNVDIKKEERAASLIQFASTTAPEVVRLSRPEDRRLLITAEKRLAAGDPKGAQELAQQALDRKIGDQGRALFILAEVAVANKNRDGAQDNFQKAIAATKDPVVLGWSHVYLGRILDMKEDRDAAVGEYRAALTSGGTQPEIKAAAEKGLQQAYEPPVKPQAQ